MGDAINQDILVRPAKTSDYRILAEMMAESDPWLRLGIGYSDLLGMVSESTREVYVAQIDDQVLGGVIIEMQGSFTGYIKSICVSTRYRSKGVGRLLMEYVEQRIFREKPNVFLCVSGFNHEAQRFYESLGYTVVGALDDYLVSGESEILM
ncbi:MAG: GNAT family N-acetyltransferase, partial [Candidatus Bathyarchaeota archaeon]|nr:GNAT family N-acetyltransferase [Candidatus Bathyarchaeota archaeon]